MADEIPLPHSNDSWTGVNKCALAFESNRDEQAIARRCGVRIESWWPARSKLFERRAASGFSDTACSDFRNGLPTVPRTLRGRLFAARVAFPKIFLQIRKIRWPPSSKKLNALATMIQFERRHLRAMACFIPFDSKASAHLFHAVHESFEMGQMEFRRPSR